MHAGGPGVHAFPTDLRARRGDLPAIEVEPGAGIGVIPGARGASTLRFTSPLRAPPARAPERGVGTGFDHALELRVEYVPRG